MEDFSYPYSPKTRDFMSTQNTGFSSSRLGSACNLCPTKSPYAKDDLTVTVSSLPYTQDKPSQDLKREYSKALNCIDILKLEKKNLQDALTITKDFKKDKTEKYFVSSTKSTALPSPKSEIRPAKSLETERRILELEAELMEQRRLVERTSAQNNELRQENYSYRERLEEVDHLQLLNHQLKADLKEMTEELRRESRRVYDLQQENDQLLDRRAQISNSARKLPPKELYKYLDNVYELVGGLNRNHYANYHFRECFVDEDNIEALIEDKQTNELLLQSFRYITDLLVNINSSVAQSNDQRRPSRTMLTESASVNQGRLEATNNPMSFTNLANASIHQYSVEEEEEAEMQTPAYPSHPQIPPTLNLNAVSREIDVQPHSFGDATPLSYQNLSPQNRTQKSMTKVYSPSNSRNMVPNSYSHMANTDVNTTRRGLSRNASSKSGVSATASPNNRRDRSPSSNKQMTEANALNVSKHSIAKSHVSHRTVAQQNAEMNALNASRQSLGKSHVSHHTTRQNVEATGLNASRVSQGTQGKSPISRQNIEANGLNASRVSQRRSPVSRQNIEANLNASRVSQATQGKTPVSRQNIEANGLNASRVSQRRSPVSHHTTRQNIDANGDVSRLSQRRSPTSHHTTRQNINNAEPEFDERLREARSIHDDFEDREMRLRELDRELQEKDRLLQMKEKELKDRSVMERSMLKYKTQQEEAEVNRSNLNQSRRLVSQKSLLKEKSLHQSKQRLDESRENTKVLKSQTQLKGQSHADIERSNVQFNNSAIQSRIIPSMSSLHDVDASPRGFGLTPKHTQPQIKSLTRVGNSVQSLDPHSEYQRSPKNFSAVVNSQRMLNPTSVQDLNDVSIGHIAPQRVPYQEPYMSAHNFENSPQAMTSPQPQTLDRLDQSGIKLIDQRGGEDYENSQIYDPTPINMISPKSNTNRHITFDVQNLGDIEECDSSPSKSMSRKMSLGDRGSENKGTEYASFRVSFGRTQSKYMRSQSPDVDSKDSLYIVDVARRKRVSHPEQTYDVVQGNEVRYDLQSMGPEYSVTKNKPRSKYEPQNQSSSHSQSQSDYIEKQATSPQSTRRVAKSATTLKEY